MPAQHEELRHVPDVVGARKMALLVHEREANQVGVKVLGAGNNVVAGRVQPPWT